MYFLLLPQLWSWMTSFVPGSWNLFLQPLSLGDLIQRSLPWSDPSYDPLSFLPPPLLLPQLWSWITSGVPRDQRVPALCHQTPPANTILYGIILAGVSLAQHICISSHLKSYHVILDLKIMILLACPYLVTIVTKHQTANIIPGIKILWRNIIARHICSTSFLKILDLLSLNAISIHSHITQS